MAGTILDWSKRADITVASPDTAGTCRRCGRLCLIRVDGQWLHKVCAEAEIDEAGDRPATQAGEVA
jgi:hypothetical protein